MERRSMIVAVLAIFLSGCNQSKSFHVSAANVARIFLKTKLIFYCKKKPFHIDVKGLLG